MNANTTIKQTLAWDICERVIPIDRDDREGA
jgi:hypothetical protein